ncbi:hypothetical protein S83_019648 [Arachis hypogaea]|uniref:4-coumarate--CoA ligase n=1 Tax=Arachis hypogaea TaxID=3818 RepID=A0A445CQD2_ARAHY|nr:hypothetical protein Ahy_A06g028130 [Arachis hypogaea]
MIFDFGTGGSCGDKGRLIEGSYKGKTKSASFIDALAPAKLEGILMSHPSIEDAAVVLQKDDVAGEVPVAFVVRSSNDPITEDAVKDFIAKQVVFYKRLYKVIFIDAIPKSSIGKILRKELKATLLSN